MINFKFASKKLLIIPFAAVLLCCLVSCGQQSVTLDGPYPNTIAENAEISDKYNENAVELAKQATEEFLAITKIPRETGHVEKIRAYLLDFAKNNNINATLDPSGCVYYDLPATEGLENNESIIIQSHMDMVVTSDPQYKFNPDTTPIDAVYDEETGAIHSRDYKTNLGADDGQGLGLSLALAKNTTIKHGPIRLLFTYNEESTFDGAINLDANVLNSKYFINFDAPRCGVVAISAAGGFNLEFEKTYTPTKCKSNSSIVELSLSGLKGGHSGTEINKNRISASSFMYEYLARLKDNNIAFEAVNVFCGTSENSIPDSLYLSLCVNEIDKDKVISMFNGLCDKYIKDHRDEKDLIYEANSYEPTTERALSVKDSLELLEAASILPNGVIKMDDHYPDVVESSANIGIFKLEEGRLYGSCLIRSNNAQTIKYEMNELKENLAKFKISTTVDSQKIIPAWPISDSGLANMYIKAWKDECGFNGTKIYPHAGMEIAYFYQKRPDIQYISVGGDVMDEHALTETFYTKSFPAAIVPVLYIIDNVNSI